MPKYSIFGLFRGSNPYSCLNQHFCIFFEPFFVRFGLTLIREIQPPNLPIFTKKPPKSAVFSMCIFFVYTLWWREMDSNHRSRRQQIYSLPPLATREPLQVWSRRWDLNPQPTDYKSVALPIELLRHFFRTPFCSASGISVKRYIELYQ